MVSTSTQGGEIFQESEAMVPSIEIDHEACDREGLCVRVCWEFVYEQADQDAPPVVAKPEMCISCGHCVAVCPGDAITLHHMDMANFGSYTAEMDIEPDRLLDFLRVRRSVRDYNQRRPVPRKVIESLVDAARYAPTGSNAQSLEHIIVQDRETIETLAAHTVDLFRAKVALCQGADALAVLEPGLAERALADLPFFERVISEHEAGLDPLFYHAPVLVITHADLSITSCPLEDATLASYHMMLVAQSVGLGTCYIGNLYEYANESQAILELLAVPPANQILMAFCLGYPALRFRRLVDRNEAQVQWLG